MSLIIVQVPLVVEQEHPELTRTGQFAKIVGLDSKRIKELCERKHNPMPSGKFKPDGHTYIKTELAIKWLMENLQPDGVIRRKEIR